MKFLNSLGVIYYEPCEHFVYTIVAGACRRLLVLHALEPQLWPFLTIGIRWLDPHYQRAVGQTNAKPPYTHTHTI